MRGHAWWETSHASQDCQGGVQGSTYAVPAVREHQAPLHACTAPTGSSELGLLYECLVTRGTAGMHIHLCQLGLPGEVPSAARMQYQPSVSIRPRHACIAPGVMLQS